MNRRGFLSMIAAGLASSALDPERLLWRPGAKTLFIPPRFSWEDEQQDVIAGGHVWVNIAATLACGYWHDGLRDSRDFLTLVPLSTVLAPVGDLKAIFERAQAMTPGWNPIIYSRLAFPVIEQLRRERRFVDPFRRLQS